MKMEERHEKNMENKHIQLKEKFDLTDFFDSVKKCNSTVTFISAEGDSLVLQSTFCQYIFASLLQKPEFIKSGVIVCKDESDYEVLKEYIYSMK